MYKLTIPALVVLIASTHAHAACNISARIAPDSRYELIGDGAEVKDKQTGLIWQRCSIGQSFNGNTCTGNAIAVDWKYALQTAKSTNKWRLPNIKELDSLVELACYEPSINENIFPNTKMSYYLSSSPSAVANVGSAWMVSFADGNNSYYKNTKTGGFVRLVRSEQ